MFPDKLFLKKISFGLFTFAVFMMLTGDFPRFPLGGDTRHLVFLIFSWPGLYFVLTGIACVLFTVGGGFEGPPPESCRFLLRPVLFLLSAFLISTIFSLEKGLSVWAFMALLTILLYLYFFAVMMDDEKNRDVLWLTAIAAVLFLAVRVIAWRLDEGLGNGTYHLKNNSWLGKLQISTVLNLCSPFLLMHFLDAKKRWLRAMAGAAWILSGYAVLILYSRMGIAVFILTTLLFFAASIKRWKLWLTVLAFLAIAFCASISRMSWGIKYVYSTSSNWESESGYGTRKGIWKETLQMFKDHPVTGIGFGAYDDVAYTRYHTPYDTNGSTGRWFFRNGWHAHNMFLHILAETGVLGLLAWLYFWAAVLARLIKRPEAADGPRIGMTAIATIGCILAFFLLSMTENLIAPRVYASMRMNLTLGFWVLIGLLSSRAPSERTS